MIFINGGGRVIGIYNAGKGMMQSKERRFIEILPPTIVFQILFFAPDDAHSSVQGSDTTMSNSTTTAHSILLNRFIMRKGIPPIITWGTLPIRIARWMTMRMMPMVTWSRTRTNGSLLSAIPGRTWSLVSHLTRTMAAGRRGISPMCTMPMAIN